MKVRAPTWRTAMAFRFWSVPSGNEATRMMRRTKEVAAMASQTTPHAAARSHRL